MRNLLTIILSLALAVSAAAQTEGLYPSTQRQQIGMSVSTVYQRYDHEDQLLEQVSIPIFVSVPIGTKFGMTLRAAGAAAGGSSGLEPVSGFADTQIGAHYSQPVGSGSIVASLGASLPSGRRELSPDEFATSILLSQKFFGFRLPVLGQGLAVSPGLTFALPVGESLALGAGASYQYKGAYTPVSTLESEYDPGDEVLLTLGADIRLAEASALSGDVTYTLYGADEMDGVTAYDPGDKISATLQYLGYQEFNALHIVARYASRGRGELPAGGGSLVLEAQRSLPDLGRLLVMYRRRTESHLNFGLLLQGRMYGSTRLFSSKQLVDVGILPELRISDAVSLTTRFVYTFGSFNGLETAAGISARM